MWEHGILVGKRMGNSTPSPTWKFGLIQADGNLTEDFEFSSNTNSLSARKLGFSLWQMQPEFNIKMSPQSPSAIPVHPLVFRDKLVESSHCFKFSIELLTALHRIRSLEEKHELDAAFVKKLSRELDQFQVQIQELMQEKKRDQEELGYLKNRTSERALSRENDTDLVEEKPKDERGLKDHSEKLHHELDNEILDVKYSLSNSCGEFERERKARILLEELCDEFAKGIRDYNRRVRFLKQKSCETEIGNEGYDRLMILHISEAWLDERARSQMKLPGAGDGSDKRSALDKFYLEIGTFLQAKQSVNSRKEGHMSSEGQKGSSSRVHSFESYHFDVPTSIPSVDNNEDDPASFKKKIQSGKDSGPSTSHVQLEVHGNGRKHQSGTDNLAGTDSPVRPRKGQMLQKSLWEGKTKNRTTDAADADQGATARNSSLISENKKLRYKNKWMMDSFDPFSCEGRPSPAHRWTSEISAEDLAVSQPSARRAKGIRPNTLMEMLREARLEDKQNRACKDLYYC